MARFASEGGRVKGGNPEVEGSIPACVVVVVDAGRVLVRVSSGAAASRLRLDPESGAPSPEGLVASGSFVEIDDCCAFCAAKAFAAAAIASMSTASSLRFFAVPCLAKSTCEYRVSVLNFSAQSTVPSEFFMFRCCAPLMPEILPAGPLESPRLPSPILARCVASYCSACLHCSACFEVSTTWPRRAW